MSTLEKIGVLAVGAGMLTTALLPKRQTTDVINAVGSAFATVMSTIMGTGVPKGVTPTGV